MKKHTLFLLLGIVLLWSCKKDEEVFPRVESLEAQPTSSTSFVFKGSVTEQGTSPVVDYGFLYSFEYSPSVQSGTKVSFGRTIQNATFEKEVTGLTTGSLGRTVYTRAYLTNGQGTVYGATIPVSLPVITIGTITPNRGRAGDRVTIQGTNFGAKSDLEVRFANAVATIIETTPTTILVAVPANISTNTYYNREIPVTVASGGQAINSYSIFNVIPTVREFAPATGTFGTPITITGDNLPQSSNYYNISVSIGGIGATITQFNPPSSITVVVPGGVQSDRVKILFTALGETTELPGEFTITPPSIASISPAAALPGATLTINGSNFKAGTDYYYNPNVVKIGTVQASITNATAGSLTVTVPAGLAPGNYPVTVSTGVHTVTSPQEFTVLSPVITSFAPMSGTVGTEVTINGQFSASQYDNAVKFGTVGAYVLSTTASGIRVHVPSGVSAGKMKITVTSGGQTVSSTDDFTVVPPTVTGFSPASGVPGTLITITGTGFSPNAYNNTVQFGTVTTSVTQATGTSITAVVPSGVNPGAMKISVTTNGILGVSAQDFTVTQ